MDPAENIFAESADQLRMFGHQNKTNHQEFMTVKKIFIRRAL